jgi:ATP synthase protein I
MSIRAMTMAPLLDKTILRHFARAGTIGFHMVISTFVGYLIGSQLDKWLVTSPWFTITFLILGIAAGFRELASITKRISDDR